MRAEDTWLKKYDSEAKDVPKLDIDDWRGQIDEIDDQLLVLLGKRAEAVREIGEIKRARGLKPLDQKRWAEVLRSRIDRGMELGLSEDFVERVYYLIHQYSLIIEGDNRSILGGRD